MSKCNFSTLQIKYLGHVIYQGTVVMDKSKVECVAQWLMPTSINELRGFLGISSYYRRFIKHYGTLAKPLTNLLKKNGWEWNDQAFIAF